MIGVCIIVPFPGMERDVNMKEPLRREGEAQWEQSPALRFFSFCVGNRALFTFSLILGRDADVW